MELVLNAPIPASLAFPILISAFTHYCIKLFKLKIKTLFAWKLSPFKHYDKGRSKSKAQKTAIGMFVQQLEIIDFIYHLVSDNFRMK